MRLGSSLWKVERVLSVKRLRVGGVQALVRWAGEHPDTWEPLASFAGDGLRSGVIGLHSKKRRIERFATATLGASPRMTQQRPARRRTQPTRTTTEGETHFRRLVRGRDARVASVGGRVLSVSVGTSLLDDGRRRTGGVDGTVESHPLELQDQRPALGSYVTIVPDLPDDIDTRIAGDDKGGTSRGAAGKRRANRVGIGGRKQRKMADDPAGAGRRRRRESAALGRRVKQRTA